ncbi:hypothetical protein [Mycolicibacterium sp. CR10]|uniref:hypothetical protein n=1 Tax=Mycolicibacterium sp. CR10 TaxID=2562314 RepID=UPI001484F25B|nr:hypothetical protein [Mycolicibacterium sp. CR10]
MTWELFAPCLTPQQIAKLERWDANPTHPNGPEAHRQGLVAVAAMYASERVN